MGKVRKGWGFSGLCKADFDSPRAIGEQRCSKVPMEQEVTHRRGHRRRCTVCAPRGSRLLRLKAWCPHILVIPLVDPTGGNIRVHSLGLLAYSITT
jgi:hypothetical protein